MAQLVKYFVPYRHKNLSSEPPEPWESQFSNSVSEVTGTMSA